MTILIFFAVLFIYWIIEPSIDAVLHSALCAGTNSDDTAIIIYSLIKAILGIAAYYLAFRLSAKWSKHRKNGKPAKIASAESDPPTEQEPTIVEPSSTAPTTPKHRFCKLCGSPIDPATRKCTGCGKQYFRPPVLRKKHLAIFTGVLACVTVVFLIFTLIAQRNAAEAKVEELNVQIADLNTKLAEQKDISHNKAMTNSALRSAFDELQKRYDKLSEEHAMYRDSLRYCESYCGFIIPTGSSMYNGVKIYHRLDCPYAESIENLVMIEIGYLEEKGYKPCPHCYG